jgi:hypothetical protein
MKKLNEQEKQLQRWAINTLIFFGILYGIALLAKFG